MQVARWLHVLAVVVWVGGMVFAHFALRPSVQALEPPVRVRLMASVLGRFFAWVTGSLVVIVATGVWWIVAAGGLAAVGFHVHAMLGVGVVMMLIYGHIRLAGYPRLAAAAAAGEIPAAASALATIRRLVVVNLVLGVLTITVAMLGKG